MKGVRYLGSASNFWTSRRPYLHPRPSFVPRFPKTGRRRSAKRNNLDTTAAITFRADPGGIGRNELTPRRASGGGRVTADLGADKGIITGKKKQLHKDFSPENPTQRQQFLRVLTINTQRGRGARASLGAISAE